MTSATSLAIGFSLGIALGWLAGRDLAASASRPRQSGARSAFGMIKRMYMLSGGLAAGLLIGGFAWLGTAIGYLASFGVTVSREALARGR